MNQRLARCLCLATVLGVTPAQSTTEPGFLEAAFLTASNNRNIAYFGVDVAMCGDTLVVGAYQGDGARSYTGAAYVFEKPATGWTTATECARLYASDGRNGDRFGYSVEISGDTIVVGAQTAAAPMGKGKAYVFEKPPGGWVDMTETAKLTASGLTDLFGETVTIDGDTILVGALQETINGQINQGAAYIFEKPTGGWVNANENTKLLASDGDWFDFFGSALAISGDTVVIAAYAANIESNVDQGALYVFEKPTGGWPALMTETVRLTASNGQASDTLGSVDIDGDVILAGAWGTDVGENLDQGAAYIFERDASGQFGGSEIAQLTGTPVGWRDRFGRSVSIDGSTAVIGSTFPLSQTGRAWWFERPPSGWTNATENGQLIASDAGTSDRFGACVVEGDVIVVGAYLADLTVGAEGAAYLFETPPMTPGSGCGSLGLTFSGSRRIGTNAGLSMELCESAATQLFVLGTPLATPFRFAPGVGCGGANPCLLSCNPVTTLPGPSATLVIPGNAAYVGIDLCVQSVCAEAPAPLCLRISEMAGVKIAL